MAAFLERFQQRHNRAVLAVLDHELCDPHVVAGLQVVQQQHHLVEPPRLDGLGAFAALVVALAALAVSLRRRGAWSPTTSSPPPVTLMWLSLGCSTVFQVIMGWSVRSGRTTAW